MPVSASIVLEVKKALMARGLLPFQAENRIHVVPPCNVSVEDAHLGLDVMDEVLSSL